MTEQAPSSVVVALPKLVAKTGSEPFRVVDELPSEMKEVAPVRRMARGIVLRDDDMLLVRQGLTGMWSIPGGGVEENETPSQAVIRELHEETGLVIRRATQALVAWERYGDDVYETHVFLCDGSQGADCMPTKEESYLEQTPEWRPISFAIGEFTKGLPDRATEWYESDGKVRERLMPVVHYLEHAEGIYAREAMILRTLFPCG